METSSPAVLIALSLVVLLFGMTGFGVYTAFGPPNRRLDDPWDEHDD